MKLLQLSLSLTIVLAPLYILRGLIPLPFFGLELPTTTLEILIFLSLLLFLLDFKKEKYNFRLLKTKFDILILFFLLNGLFSVIVSSDQIGGFGIFRAYFLEPVLFYYLLNYEFKKNKNYMFVIHSLILSGVWISLLGLLQKITGSYTFAPNEISQGRITAVYNSANSLSLYLGPIAIFALLLFKQSAKKLKLFYFLILSFMLLIIYWTKSRGGLVAEVLSILIFVYAFLASGDGKIIGIRTSRLRRYWLVLPLGILIAIVFFFHQVFAIYSTYPPNIASREVRGDTLHIRYLIWKSTLEMLKDSPIFGAGLEGFKQEYVSYYKPAIYSEDFQYPHNLFLTFWTETGLAGLLIFLLIIYKGFYLLLKNLRKSHQKILTAALLGALSYILIHGMVDVPYFKNDLSLLFWILLVLVNISVSRVNISPSVRS